MIRIPYFSSVPRKFLWGHLKSAVYESNPHTIQELKDNISHAVATIKITMLHRVYLNMIKRAHLCTNAGGNRFQHLLGWYILSALGYCIHFCIYAMLRSRATFPCPTLYSILFNSLYLLDSTWSVTGYTV